MVKNPQKKKYDDYETKNVDIQNQSSVKRTEVFSDEPIEYKLFNN